MRTLLLLATLSTLGSPRICRAQTIPHGTSTQSHHDDDTTRRAAEAAEEAARLERERAATQGLLLRGGFDPAKLHTVAVWPNKPLRCKLPKNEEPYTCHRLIAGPAVILTPLAGLELIAARDDLALLRGQRLWWLHNYVGLTPIALAANEVLYVLGDLRNGDTDIVMTVYKP
jgi:hypothetical protein